MFEVMAGKLEADIRKRPVNTPEAVRVLQSFERQPVLVVGDVMLDRYLWGTVTRVSPEAPVPIVARQRTTCSPGGAANVAASIAALGGKPLLMSIAGEEASGRELHASLAERGVDSNGVILSPARRTTVKTRIIAHNQQLLRIDEEDIEPLDAAHEEVLLTNVTSALNSVKVVVLSDYAKGLLTQRVIAAIVSQARLRGVPVLVDPKGAEYSRYNGASLLTPNRSEAFLAAGLAHEAGATVAAAGVRLMESLGIDSLLITEGESGMTLFERSGSAVHLTASARVVYDVTGAGDAVIATLAMALAAGSSLRTATLLANVAGGLSVEQVGTAMITVDAIERVFNETPHRLPRSSEVRSAATGGIQ